MSQALLGLGANLGDRSRQLQLALAELNALADVQVDRVSRFLETQPVGGPNAQPDYLNAAATLTVSTTPQLLWESLASIEAKLGRTRVTRWGARSIDLDLLLFDDLIVETRELTIPHPRLALRRFVLEPAAEIAPTMVHPRIGWTIGRLFEHLRTAPLVLHLLGSTSQTRERLGEQLRSWDSSWLIESFAEIPPADSPLVSFPKLTLLLDEPTPEGTSLRRRVEESRRGPYLIVDANDWPRLWDEATAALQKSP